MTDQNDAPFANEILSVETANPGWFVHVQHLYKDPGALRPEVEEEYRFVIAAWAMVKRTFADGREATAAEPIFVEGGRLINATEYRRLHSDLDPAAGQPEIRIRINVEPPVAPEAGAS